MSKENKKELICRHCNKFLDSKDLKKGKCPSCGDDEGIFINDLNADYDSSKTPTCIWAYQNA